MPFHGVGDSAVRVDVHDSNMPRMSESDTTAIKGEVICMADLHFMKGAKRRRNAHFPEGSLPQEH